MKENKWYLSLFTLLVAVLVLFSASCITVYEKKPTDSKPGTPATPSANAAPVIKSFTATPASVNSGQQSQLKWEVSGATKVEINPIVGTVDPVSIVLVSPTTTTTYTLMATNAVGTSSATVAVTVAGGASAARPDLVITDIWVVSKEVYYKVKNIGGEVAKGGARAYLYVNDLKQADDYIETLAPGQERSSPFPNYSWSYVLPEPRGYFSAELPKQFVLKVSADVENVIVESDEANNSMIVIMGEKYVYPFASFAHQAAWTTGYGPLKLPLPEESAVGAAMVANVALEDGQGYSSVLVTIPQQVPNGWIQGRFGEFYTDELRQTRVREIPIPATSKFTARVGFTRDTAPNSKARFIFSVVDQSGSVRPFPAVTASNDGKLELYEVDLSSVVGQKVSFLLRVEAIDSAEKVKPAWVDPRLLQP